MVFSFFKKTPQKMVTRPAATPRQREPVAAPAPSAQPAHGEQEAPAVDKSVPLEFTPSSAGAGAPPPVLDDASDFSDSEFGASQLSFEVDDHNDPLAAEIEEAAVLFANGQDEATSAVLENAVRMYASGPGERLWLMLFDFYRLFGKKAPFEALGMEYAKAFEKSPPAWRDKSSGAGTKVPVALTGSVLFGGELTGDNQAGFATVEKALAKGATLRLDLSKVTFLDEEGCNRLFQLLRPGKAVEYKIELLGRDTLGGLLSPHIVVGTPEHKGYWLLYLELCQLQGERERFEDIAVDYAVTFEVSPPSWESARVAAPELVAKQSVGVANKGKTDAYVLDGEIKSARFADLPDYATGHDPVLIECSALVRVDFISAGALVNVLSSIRQKGRRVIFRHPNHLVAALFGLVGLNAIATIVFEKY